jgi:hypothetical protein
MKRLVLISVFCTLGLLLVGTYSTTPVASKGLSGAVSWWVTLNPQNNRWVTVTVKVHSDYCIRPDLSFHFNYRDLAGNEWTVSRDLHIRKPYRDDVCDETWSAQYQLSHPAAELVMKGSSISFIVVPISLPSDLDP